MKQNRIRILRDKYADEFDRILETEYQDISKSELNFFRAYLNMLEEDFLDAENREIELWEEIEEKLENEYGELEETVEELTVLRHLSNLLRRSYFLSIYALLETRMMAMCRNVEKRSDVSISLSGIRETGIDKANEFLKKALNIKLGDLNDWPEIKNYKRLRNCVVHNQGRLEGFYDRNDSLKNYIIDKSSLSLSPSSEIRFDKEFCEETIEVIQRFLNAISDKLPST